MAINYMTDREIEDLEERMLDALNGDHCAAIDTLCRGLLRTLGELKVRRASDPVKIRRFAQSA